MSCPSSSPSGTPMIRMLEHLKLSRRSVPRPLLTFFEFLFLHSVYFFLLLQIINLSPSLLPVTVGSLYIFLYFTFIAFTSSSTLWPYSTNSVSILITSVLNCASDRLAISSLLSCIFFWSFDQYFHLGHIFLTQCSWYIARGGALGVHQDGATHIASLCCCMWGRGPRGNSAACLTLGQLSVTSPTTSKLDPFGANSQVGGLVYVLQPCGSLQQTLLWGWEFLLLLQPPQVFISIGFEALVSHAGTLGCMVCLTPQLFLLVNVGLTGLPATVLSTPVR